MPLPNLCETTRLLTYLSLKHSQIHRNSDMTEFSDKTIMTAYLAASFNGHSKDDYFCVPYSNFVIWKEKAPGRGEITEIATGEKSSPFMTILKGWFCLPIAIYVFPYLIFLGPATCLLLQCGYCLLSQCGPSLLFQLPNNFGASLVLSSWVRRVDLWTIDRV